MERAPVPDWKTFMTAGKAVFTIQNEKTGGRFTFRVRQSKKWHWMHFVSVLTGPNNDEHYTYIGVIKHKVGFTTTEKSKLGKDAPSVRAFSWLDQIRRSPHDLPPAAHFYHEGRCGRCGRRLTVPLSIKQGFGPECINFVGRR